MINKYKWMQKILIIWMNVKDNEIDIDIYKKWRINNIRL